MINNMIDLLESRTLYSTTASFGLVETKPNTKLKLTDTDGTAITYTLKGPGTGTVVTADNGTADLSFTGTTSATKVAITTKGGDKVGIIHTLTADAAIGTITAAKVNVTDNLTFAADLAMIQLGNVTGNLNASFGGSTPIAITFGNVTDMILKSTAPIKSLTVASWVDTNDTDVLTAPSLGATISKGEFDPDLTISTTIKSMTVAGRMYSSLWYVGENVGPVVIKGELNHSSLFVGPGFGADNKPTTKDDVFSTASIKSLTVNGNVIFTWVSANLDPVDPYYRDGTDKVVAGGVIGKVAIKGTLSADSRILAETLPATIKEANKKVSTATDFRFHSTDPDQLTG